MARAGRGLLGYTLCTGLGALASPWLVAASVQAGAAFEGWLDRAEVLFALPAGQGLLVLLLAPVLYAGRRLLF